MIRIDRGLEHARPLLSFEAQRLQQLVDDLRGMAEGSSPSQGVLQAAPVADDWTFGSRPVPMIFGHVFGHPRLATGPVCTTEVIALDLQAGWARTLSRFYVLGQPMGGTHV